MRVEEDEISIIEIFCGGRHACKRGCFRRRGDDGGMGGAAAVQGRDVRRLFPHFLGALGRKSRRIER
jgi:hypothetical protein